MLFVSGLNIRTTNPRWRTAAILKIEKSRYIGNCLTNEREMRQGATVIHYDPPLHIGHQNFEFSKIINSGRLEC